MNNIKKRNNSTTEEPLFQILPPSQKQKYSQNQSEDIEKLKVKNARGVEAGKSTTDGSTWSINDETDQNKSLQNYDEGAQAENAEYEEEDAVANHGTDMLPSTTTPNFHIEEFQHMEFDTGNAMSDVMKNDSSLIMSSSDIPMTYQIFDFLPSEVLIALTQKPNNHTIGSCSKLPYYKMHAERRYCQRPCRTCKKNTVKYCIQCSMSRHNFFDWVMVCHACYEQHLQMSHGIIEVDHSK